MRFPTLELLQPMMLADGVTLSQFVCVRNERRISTTSCHGRGERPNRIIVESYGISYGDTIRCHGFTLHPHLIPYTYTRGETMTTSYRFKQPFSHRSVTLTDQQPI